MKEQLSKTLQTLIIIPKFSPQKTKTLYQGARMWMIGNLLLSGFLALVQKQEISHRVLITWFGCSVLLTLLRLLLVYRYRLASTQSLETVRWDTLYIIGVIFNGMVWGSAGIFLFPSGSLAHQLFLCFVLGGIVMGTVGAYASVPEVFFSFGSIAMVPFTVRLLAQGSEIHLGIALICLLFIAVVWINARNMTTVNSVSSKLQDEIQERIQTEKKLDEEKMKFQRLLENVPFGIMVNDRGGSLKYINPTFKKLFGYDLEDTPNGKIWFRKAYSDPIYRHDVISTWKNDIRSFRSGEAAVRSFTVTCKDGKERVIQFLAVPVEEGDSLTVCEDITERQHAESMLRESEKRFRDLVENSLTAISIVQDDQVVYHNSEMERLFGPLTESYRFSRFLEGNSEDLKKAKEWYNNKKVSGEDYRRDVSLRFSYEGKENGSSDVRWIVCRLSRIQYMGREAILTNMMDITQTIKLEHQIMINDKMTSLGRIATGIIHELRNPLSGINIYLSSLRKMCDASGGQQLEDVEKVETIVERVQSASNKIEAVIKRVMDFSKPGISKLVLTDLNQTIEEAASLCSVTLRRKGISLEKNFQGGILQCYIDPQLIEQVILNLVTNAGQAVEHTRGEKKIELSSWREQNWACISVDDSGPGIPQALRGKIFDPFFTTKEEGIGIGLSLCQRIIADHGGVLDVDTSSLGGGQNSGLKFL